MEKKGVDHSDSLGYLKKIEGQIRGVQKMIEEERYCIDILTQLHSVVGAILSVEDKILKKHLEHCVVSALKARSRKDVEAKIEEIVKLVSQFRR
ncbi:MAG: metal-sensitive transcriptional regulator [Candidatus Omnitrophica bacterium]|nr:metal-sensitive transcriptional regulator [Candidatus Omnitrophota bacterium]